MCGGKIARYDMVCSRKHCFRLLFLFDFCVTYGIFEKWSATILRSLDFV